MTNEEMVEKLIEACEELLEIVQILKEQISEIVDTKKNRQKSFITARQLQKNGC